MVRKGSTIRDRVGEAYGNTFGRNQDSFMNRPNSKGPQVSAKVLQSSQDKIIGHLKDAGVKAAAPLAQKIMQNVPLAGKVGTMYNLLSPEQKQAITTVAMKAFKGQPLPTTISKGDSVMNSSYGLSKAPNPKPVSLNSGIAPNCYANDFMSPVANTCVPMHMNCATLQIPTEITHPLNIYFQQTIAFDIQTRAQANVGFNLDIVTNLSSIKLLEAMNAAISALQIYFYYSSILSYESEPRNKNSAMIELRQRITPQIISDMVQLGRRLEDTPIPPRIVEWVRYMSMNYLSGNSQGSPLLKLCPNVTCTEAAIPLGNTLAADALIRLNSTDIVSTFTLMRRSIPQWRVGKLFDIPVMPCYDKDFVTIFNNTGSKHYTGTVNYEFPRTSGVGNLITYNSYNNKLDGAAYSMVGIYDTTTLLWYPGLLQPNNSASSFSRRSFYVVAGVPVWVNSSSDTFVINSRQDTYRVEGTGTTSIAKHLFAAERVLGVSGSTCLQTSRNFMDFIFNVNSIPVRGKLSHFNEPSNNIIRFKI